MDKKEEKDMIVAVKPIDKTGKNGVNKREERNFEEASWISISSN